MTPSASNEQFVVGVTATFRRPAEIQRLIESLPGAGLAMRAIVVVDNAGDTFTRKIVNASVVTAEYFAPGDNLGCGGGLHEGERLALEKFGDQLTHLWILDDDTVIAPGALDVLLEEMARTDADAAHPLVVDASGQLGWYPGLIDPEKFRVIREPQTPEQFISRCGDAPVPFSWAQGIALLLSRSVLEQLGYHRTDYWVRGEDLEFSLRITYRFRGIYVPRARVEHLPPSPSGVISEQAEYTKHRAMLQNIAYTALRLPHGHRIARTIPGNWLRFFRTWGWRPSVFADALRVLWRGGVRKWPAGHPNSRFAAS